MTGSELRRFVGGPFPNLAPALAGAVPAHGPLPNLGPADRLPGASAHDEARPAPAGHDGAPTPS